MAGRIVVLLLLIFVLIGGGIVWFDYLNVIDAKSVLSPVYGFLRKVPLVNRIVPEGEGRTQPDTPPDETLSLDGERYAVRLEAIALRDAELDLREAEIQSRRGEIEQMAQELAERTAALEEQENSVKALMQEADIVSSNVEQNARYLSSMPPDAAVGILAKMDDQLVIDVFRKTEEIAQAEGNASLVSVWMARLDPARAAELQRKMAGRPAGLN